MPGPTIKPIFLWKHLNKLRWLSLSVVFFMLLLIPLMHLYQTYVAAHAYDLLGPGEKQFYDVMETITSPFVADPEKQLDAVKGNTWSGTFLGPATQRSTRSRRADRRKSEHIRGFFTDRFIANSINGGFWPIFLRLDLPGDPAVRTEYQSGCAITQSRSAYRQRSATIVDSNIWYWLWE